MPPGLGTPAPVDYGVHLTPSEKQRYLIAPDLLKKKDSAMATHIQSCFPSRLVRMEYAKKCDRSGLALLKILSDEEAKGNGDKRRQAVESKMTDLMREGVHDSSVSAFTEWREAFLEQNTMLSVPLVDTVLARRGWCW